MSDSDIPAHLRDLTASEIETRISKLRAIDLRALTDEELTEAIILHKLGRRKTAGPPKPKAAKATPLSLSDLDKLIPG